MKFIWLSQGGILMEYNGLQPPEPISKVVTVRHHRLGLLGGKNYELSLEDGWHAGPLFNEYGKRRAPILRTSRQHGARRRAREKRATPAWLTQEQRAEIRALYRCCEELNELAGYVKYVVDHIVPLDGKLVCGQHVPWNLRIITKLENERKGWLTWPDMPMEQLELI